MENFYTGDSDLLIGKQRLTLCFDWHAFAAIRSRFGKKADQLGMLIADSGPEPLAAIISIGLAKHHPDWTEAAVMKASPPIRPTVNAVVRAVNIAYHGTPDLPEDVVPANPPMRRLSRWVARLLTRSGSESKQPSN